MNRVGFFLFLMGSAAFAQKFDFVASAGARLDPVNQFNFSQFSSSVSGGRFSALLNPSFAVYSGRSAKISAEIPFIVNPNGEVNITSNFVSAQGTTWGVTPGARVNFAPESRFSPFGAFGAGLFRASGARVGTNVFNVGTSRDFALGYGGGLDVKIVGPLKARAEIRNYSIDTSGSWRNRTFFFGGIGVQF